MGTETNKNIQNPGVPGDMPGGWPSGAQGAAFLTGAVMAVFLYAILRLTGAKWIVNSVSAVIMAYALLGVAAGGLAQAGIRESVTRRWIPLIFAVAAAHLFCAAYNLNLSTTYLLPVNGFSLYTPVGMGRHVAAEIFFFAALPCVFFIPGYYFAECFGRVESPHGAYAAHTLGFMLGGIAGFYIVTTWSPIVAIGGGLAVMALFLARDRRVYATLFFAAAIASTAYSFRAPEMFFTWSTRDYKNLETKWSPYFKLDFLSFDDGHCIAGTYNNLFLYYTCDAPEKAHLQVREIYSGLVKGKKQILVVGGSLGEGINYMTAYEDSLKHAVSVEIDPVVEARSTGKYGHFCRNVLNRPDVESHAGDGRAFLDRDKRKFDMIFLDGLDNRMFFTPMSPIAAENYMFTREALHSLFDHLNGNGILTIDVGGVTTTDYVAPFLAGLPKNVNYELFWYVVPDRPMVGLALYFIVASKDPAALKAAADYVKTIPSIKHIPKHPVHTGPAPTDDRPILLNIFPYQTGDALVVISLMIIASAMLGRLRYSRKYGVSLAFPWAAFALLGFAFIFTEFCFVFKYARFFSGGPAFGAVILTAFFMTGSFAVNAAFGPFKRMDPDSVKFLSAIPAAVAALALVLSAILKIQNPAIACALTFLAGAGCGFFWPMLLHAMPWADRRAAYAVDTIGSAIGGILFFFEFANYGFRSVTLATAAGLMLYFVYAAVRIETVGNVEEDGAG